MLAKVPADGFRRIFQAWDFIAADRCHYSCRDLHRFAYTLQTVHELAR